MVIIPLIGPSELATKRLIYKKAHDRNITEVSETMNKTVFFNAISMVSTPPNRSRFSQCCIIYAA